MRCIDFEAHYYPVEFIEAIKDRKEMPRLDLETDMIYYTGTDGCVGWERLAGKNGQDLLDIGDYRISEMDASGTDMQVLSAAQGIEMLPPEVAIPVAHASNKSVHDAMVKYPGRFQGMAALPLCDVEASIKELEICMKEYGFVGMNTFSYLGNGNYPDDEKFEPLYAKAAELGAFVYLHPAHAELERLHGAGPQLLSAALGFGIDTLISFGRILASGLLDRYENLKIIMGHYGESIPFIYNRFNNHSLGAGTRATDRGNAKNIHKFGYYVDNNLYVTCSGMSSLAEFECTKAVLGMEKIMFGSDYPMDRPHPRTKKYIESLPMSKEEREMIFCKNAERLFGI